MKWLARLLAFRVSARRATSSALLATPCYVPQAVAVFEQLPHMLCYMPLTAVAVVAAQATLLDAAV